MKYLSIDDIKVQLRLDFDCDDALLELCACGAENTILYLCNRTYENLVGTYGEVPPAIRQLTLELVDIGYTHRSPVSPTNMSLVPYNFELLLYEYVALAGTPMLNERDRIVNTLQAEKANIDFFASDDQSDTKTDLCQRIDDMITKFMNVPSLTPMILISMGDSLKKMDDDVNAYLKSLTS